MLEAKVALQQAEIIRLTTLLNKQAF
jgi:uncharacterized small protein (DUF1192 family)